MNGELVKRQDRWDLYAEDGSKIGSSAPNPMNKLSLKNCEAIANGYDLDELEELAQKDIHNLKPINPHPTSFFAGYRRGFQKALEILGDKKFSEEDVISMIEKSRETGLTSEYLILTKQQTEWDVEIEMDICGDKVYAVPEPALDENGCLILKRKS